MVTVMLYAIGRRVKVVIITGVNAFKKE